MYQALYRKYRPSSFDDVAGQKHITETLRRQIVSGRYTHAYLFVGTRGTGKTTCAKILARAINCQNPEDGNPCNKCASCVGIENGTILDVLELDAASNNGVDDVRAMRNESIYSPVSALKRVYIIDEVHMLSTPAFNALLKTLEEPPEHIVFILATTELHKVLPTIQSRCQKFSFRRLSSEEIIGYLTKIAASENLTLTQEAAEKLAMLADGSMRDAISLLDQCVCDKPIDLEHVLDTIGLAGDDDLLSLIDAIISCDTALALRIQDRLYNDGKDMAALIGELSGIIRDLMVIKLDADTSLICSNVSRAALLDISGKAASERLFYCLDILKNAIFGLSRAGLSRLALEMCIIKMCDERLLDDTSALAARVARLEGCSSSLTAAVSVVGTPVSKPESKIAAPAAVFAPPLAAPIAPSAPAADAVPAASASAAKQAAEISPVSFDKPDPNADILTQVLSQIEDRAVHTFLSNKNKAEGFLDDNTFVIKLTDAFGVGVLKNSYMDTLKTAVCKVLNKDVAVRLETAESAAAQDNGGKIERLKQFDIVSFE
ncbi:MAG: DNA polymerase III subunit gamma/tau [Oscillospiraceae bacterium]|nr:DNA polymerase III subunit gamma/tau [Oscillospiraceae bacterium]